MVGNYGRCPPNEYNKKLSVEMLNGQLTIGYQLLYNEVVRKLYTQIGRNTDRTKKNPYSPYP